MIKFSILRTPIDKQLENKFFSLKKKGILQRNSQFLNFHDEPQFFQYRCENIFKKATATGASNYKNEAYATAMYEAVERFCILNSPSFKKIRGSYKKLKPHAINPILFQAMSKVQLSQKHYEKFNYDEDSIFNWIQGYSLIDNKKVLIPMQLTFIDYKVDENDEPTIRIPISTGAACGPTTDFAIYKGICETLEKDAYMIRYLNKSPKYSVDISADKELQNIKEKIERYNLTLHIIDISLEFSSTSIMAIIIDDTGIGPAVTVGLGTSLDPKQAVKSAIFEAIMIRSERSELFFTNKKFDMSNVESHYKNLLKKHQLWSAPHMRFKIKQFIEAPKKLISDFPNLSQKNDKENVNLLVSELKVKKYDVFIVNISNQEINSENLVVTKVLIPQLLPHYHDENYPYKSNSRLYTILETLGEGKTEITENTIESSHPF